VNKRKIIASCIALGTLTRKIITSGKLQVNWPAVGKPVWAEVKMKPNPIWARPNKNAKTYIECPKKVKFKNVWLPPIKKFPYEKLHDNSKLRNINNFPLSFCIFHSQI
jgi:hypothetical protein